MNMMVLTVPYLSEASINHCFIRGQVRYGYKPVVRGWRKDLTLLVANQQQLKTIKPPIQIEYCILYPTRTRKGDPPNFAKIIQDAICEGLGFDDDMTNVTIGPVTGYKTKHKVGTIILLIREIPSMASVLSAELATELNEQVKEFELKDGMGILSCGDGQAGSSACAPADDHAGRDVQPAPVGAGALGTGERQRVDAGESSSLVQAPENTPVKPNTR